MRDEQVSLYVWGKVLSGWTSVEIIDSLEALSPTFALSYSDRALEVDGALRISPGDQCSVRIGGQTVITGYVDDSELEESATSRSLSVSGRSRTCDLVDCSVPQQTSEWLDASLDTIASDLCAPFGISVSVQAPVGAPFVRFAVEPGETVIECISRAARERGVMLQSSSTGTLVLSSVGARSAPAALERGVNVLSTQLSLSVAERFSEVRLLSQSDGEDGLFNKPAAQASAAARDANIRRHRPLVLVSDCGESQDKLKERALWEVSSRAGRGSRLSVTVRGWGSGGSLWRPNAHVRVVHDWLGLNTSMLIASVRLSLDEGGTLTELELCPAGAFAPEPVAAKAKPESTWP